MKRWWIWPLMVVGLGLAFAGAGPHPVPSVVRVAKSNETITLQLDSLHCGSCVEALKTRLAGLPGVTKVEVDVEKARAVLTASVMPGREELQKALTEAGVKLRSDAMAAAGAQ